MEEIGVMGEHSFPILLTLPTFLTLAALCLDNFCLSMEINNGPSTN